MTNKYPFYSDEPGLNLKTVVTYKGTTEYRVNCVRYPEGYYVKNIDLIFYEPTKKWTKKANLIYDYEKKEYFKKPTGMIKGIVAVENGNLVSGYFTPNSYNNCIVKTYEGKKIAISPDILDDNIAREDYSKGEWVMLNTLNDYEANNLKIKRKGRNNNDKPYNVADDPETFNRKIDLYNNYKEKIRQDLLTSGRYLGDLTYGLEIETVNGDLPNYIANRYGVMVCRDGSLRDDDGNYPPEFVTVPYKGAKGLHSIERICSEISKRCDISNKCSVHIHFGNIPKDRLFLVAFYNLMIKIQNQIFDIFPFYKRDEVKFANKDKNYCKLLPDIIRPYGTGNYINYINDSYEQIYSFLTKRKFDKKNNAVNKRNPFGRSKWNIPTRYYWVNFTNLIFGKHETIEFRIHTPTTNSDKITAWLFMCAAMIKYAEKNIKKCLSVNDISFRDDVLSVFTTPSAYSKKLVHNLQRYYDVRKEYFEDHFKKEDYISESEIQEDETFTFNITK